MKYWVKSVPPLIVEKGFFETTAEMLTWMESVLKRTEEYFKDNKEVFPPNSKTDILEDCFVILKVDTTTEPRLKKALGDRTKGTRRKKRINKLFPTVLRTYSEKREPVKKGRKRKNALETKPRC